MSKDKVEKLEVVEETKSVSKLGKQEKFVGKRSETEFTFQFPGVRRAQQILDASKSVGGGFVDEAYHELLMSEIIVEPKVDWDYWDENPGYREVLANADNFLGRMLN